MNKKLHKFRDVLETQAYYLINNGDGFVILVSNMDLIDNQNAPSGLIACLTTLMPSFLTTLIENEL